MSALTDGLRWMSARWPYTPERRLDLYRLIAKDRRLPGYEYKYEHKYEHEHEYESEYVFQFNRDDSKPRDLTYRVFKSRTPEKPVEQPLCCQTLGPPTLTPQSRVISGSVGNVQISFTVAKPKLPILPDIDLDAPKKIKVAPKPKKVCASCSREWCEALDAYYGKHPDGSSYCSPCRDKLKIR